MTLERLGNLHLVFLHLPIGFVVAAVLIECWRWRRPSVEGAWLQGRLLAANAVATLLTAGAGLVLAGTGSYDADTLGLHRWAGVVCAGLAIAVWLTHAKGRVAGARVLLAGLLAVTIFAGHQGATLTHGPEVTAWWPAREIVWVEVPGAENSVFTLEIQPLLERSCVECHGPRRSRGGLRLDSREAALAGGKSGLAAIAPGRPEASEALRRVKLPHDDDDFMPGGENPPLTADEIAALARWIADGAVWR